MKPFSTDNVHQIVERHFDKQASFNVDWMKLLREARTALEEKRFQESEDLYANCAKLFSQNPSVLTECSEFFLKRGMDKMALQLAEKILVGNPGNVRALNCVGMALKGLGRFSEAVEKLMKANRLSPLNSARHLNLAEIYIQMAEEEVQQALRSEDASSSLILTKARYQLLRKDYSALVTYLDAKRGFLSDAGKKDADVLVSVAKKLGGII